MSLIILNVDEVRRTLSASGGAFVVHDKEVDIVRFAINSGFADIVLDGQVALRVMYQRPGETEVRAQTLTYYDTDGLRSYYDWQLLSADLAEKGTLTVALCILRTDGDVEEWHTTPCQIRVLNTIHTDDSDEGDESITPTVAQRVAVLETMIQRVASGAPIVVASTSAMTDTSQIYVLSTDGNWYYHNGTAWTAGGEYGAVATDRTLTQEGVPADAKAVGDAIDDVNFNLDALDDRVEALEKGGGGAWSDVPSYVKSAMLAIFEAGTYTRDVSDHVAVISSWASEISEVVVSPATANISGASMIQLTATTTPAGGTIIWKSSNVRVATVSNSGLVTGVGNGSATIVARCGSHSAKCTVAVSGFKNLTSISAIYSGGAVGDNTEINDLKAYLVVTAHYDDDTTEIVTDYTLSGTLTEGTSTIVVVYNGKITTFTVTVTHVIDYTQPGSYTFVDDKWANKGITENFSVSGGTLEDRFSVDDMRTFTRMELVPVSANGVSISFEASEYKLVPVTFKPDKTYKFVDSVDKYFTTSPAVISASVIANNSIAYITFYVVKKTGADISYADLSDINLTLEVA